MFYLSMLQIVQNIDDGSTFITDGQSDNRKIVIYFCPVCSILGSPHPSTGWRDLWLRHLQLHFYFRIAT